MHDLLRTADSSMTVAKVSRVVVGKILAHAERDITCSTYDQYAYGTEMRARLARSARRLEAIVTGAAGGQVVDFPVRA